MFPLAERNIETKSILAIVHMLPLKAIISDEGRFVSLNVLMDHIKRLLLHSFEGNNYKTITFLYLKEYKQHRYTCICLFMYPCVQFHSGTNTFEVAYSHSPSAPRTQEESHANCNWRILGTHTLISSKVESTLFFNRAWTSQWSLHHYSSPSSITCNLSYVHEHQRLNMEFAKLQWRETWLQYNILIC